MELYKIIATCTNYAGAGNPRTLSYIPENFKGVKIAQKFSWINPIGYTPKFSIETMRAISTDKIWLDAIFDLYGTFAVVNFAIYKLNATASDYTLISTFTIDFESYVKSDYYSEFALKSISCIDIYNETKSTIKDFTGAASLAIPDTQEYINYVSVEKTTGGLNEDNTAYLCLIGNKTSKFYNDDMALGDEDEKILYQFYRDPSTANLTFSANGLLSVYISGGTVSPVVSIGIYKNDYSTLVLAITATATVESYGVSLDIQMPKTQIEDFAFADEDFFFIGVIVEEAGAEITDVLGDFSAELYVTTELNANKYDKKLYYLTAESILNSVFNDQATIETELKSIGVTSGQSILSRLNYISLMPKDFLTDFCLATGAIVNFKNDGTVDISRMSTYFTNLLDIANAIEVTNFKNVEISADTELNFSGVSVGMEVKEYDVYTYLNDWNKILTFIQSGRVVSEKLSLELSKFRVDFSGMLDLMNVLNSTDKSSDLFLFDPAFTPRSTNEGFIYDRYTPRDILENWRKFLEFCFYNYGQDALTFLSSSGSDFNLEIEPGVKQFDVFGLAGDITKILPLKINFDCLIGDTDFTESILKINYKGEDLFIFVTEAQTTDNLDEQKIKGNLIYFPS